MIGNGYKPKLTAFASHVLAPTGDELHIIEREVHHTAEIRNNAGGIPQIHKVDDPDGVIQAKLDKLVLDKLLFVAHHAPWYGKNYDRIGVRWQKLFGKYPGDRYALITLTHCPIYQQKKDENLEDALRILLQTNPPYSMDRLKRVFA